MLIGLSSCVGLAAISATNILEEGSARVYIGTYTRPGGSEGIYLLDLDLSSGKLSTPKLAGTAANPSFLAHHPTKPFLYAVGELGTFQGKKGGGVFAFGVEPETGLLRRINEQSTRGPGPCHLGLDREGKHLVAANYSGGSIAAFPVGDDGALGEASSFVQHEGSSVNPKRQEGPHAHGIHFDTTGGTFAVPDLGLDKVFLNRIDPKNGAIKQAKTPFFSVEPAGSGPRHLAFHPSGRFAYVINELASTVIALEYDPENPGFSALQTITTLPEGYQGNSTTAEVVVHPSGRFLYGSNRGHDSIAIFGIEAETGRLSALGHVATQGRTPRCFAIDPSGRYLVTANQDSDTVVAFRIDPGTGQLEPTGSTVQVAAPVCVLFTD